MSKPIKKEKWGKPKLFILTRGDRQETVLEICKATDGGEFHGALLWHAYCGESKLCPLGCLNRAPS